MKMNVKKLTLSFALIFLSGQFIQCKENKQSVAENIVTEVTPTEVTENQVQPEPSGNSENSDPIKLTELTKNNLPKDVKFKGEFHKGFSFIDREGEKILVLSQLTKRNPAVSEYGGTIEMYAQLYTQSGNSFERTWLMQDFERDCDLDNQAKFHEDFPIVTDLDYSGIYEVWIQYYLGCGGDVAPNIMKLLMYEGSKKHAMRGDQTLLHLYNDETRKEGGEFKFDDAFKNSPQVFRDYAEKLWNEKGTEEIDWRD